MQDSREQEVNVSHVDEGMLHAYLDGELPAPERAALEIHIAQCATCGARLAEERSLIERASAVLGAARPSERPAPRLKERRILGARLPFAWAATVLLALGIGYYLHAPESPVPPAPEPQTVAMTRDQHLRPHILGPEEWRQKMLPVPHRQNDRHLFDDPFDCARRLDRESRRVPDKAQVIRGSHPDRSLDPIGPGDLPQRQHAKICPVSAPDLGRAPQDRAAGAGER